MKIHNNLVQGTEEWFAVRRGKLTASNAQAISANGKGLETYVYQVMAEKYSNNRDQYTNADIIRGNELEPLARMTYSIERSPVEEVGFVEMNKFVGCSPDGLIGKDGGLELKCVNDVNFFKLLVNKEKAIETKYIWQCQMCLLVTERKWWDLAFYNQNFDTNLIVFRILPEEVKQTKLTDGIIKGINLIKELTKKYEKK